MSDTQAFAAQLRKETVAMRVLHTKFHPRRSLSPAQRAQAASTFHASGSRLSASKKLLNTNHPLYRKVTNCRTKAIQLWKSMSVPYPETGIRLIRRDALDTFNKQMAEISDDLRRAAIELQNNYATLRFDAQSELGELFNSDDYPPQIDEHFSLAWNVVNTDPPAYLKQIAPAMYKQEQERIAAQFSEAVQLTEEAFAAELSNIVTHLVERLKGTKDGKPMVFRDTAVQNLTEFFDRFGTLSINSDEALQQVVAEAKQALGGATPKQLRTVESLRNTVGEQLASVSGAIDKMMTARPKRRITFDEDGE